jgi:hypothetical protein
MTMLLKIKECFAAPMQPWSWFIAGERFEPTTNPYHPR